VHVYLHSKRLLPFQFRNIYTLSTDFPPRHKILKSFPKIKSKSKSQFRQSASDKVDLFRFQTKKNNLKRIPYVTSLDPLFELK
jgi:hypothetical protein